MGSLHPISEERTQREALLKRFLKVRENTEKLCGPLAHEDFMVSATEDTSPPKWHLAHTSWFFENFILNRHMRGYEPFRPEFGFLFNSYYRGVGRFLPKSHRRDLSRPSVDEVFQYRRLVTETVHRFLTSVTEKEYLKLGRILELGINHEEQHQELLLMDIKRNFYENPTRPKYQTHEPPHLYDGEVPEWHNLPSGPVKIGVDRNTKNFAYDNEKDSHTHWIESCMLSSHLVTNDEYLAFIDEGGYDNPLLWLSDGWDYKESHRWEHPLYWEKDGQNWWTMSLSGMIPLDLGAPVCHISYYEAQAFAHWKGCRLPTEQEWETAAQEEPLEGVFLEDGEYEALASDGHYQNYSQIHGTLWEWTQSAYLPYPRYEKFHDGLSEYNEKFMCNQFVMRGGSCITSKDHYRPTYRNFYYPHMRWQYSGFRLAKDLA